MGSTNAGLALPAPSWLLLGVILDPCDPVRILPTLDSAQQEVTLNLCRDLHLVWAAFGELGINSW